MKTLIMMLFINIFSLNIGEHKKINNSINTSIQRIEEHTSLEGCFIGERFNNIIYNVDIVIYQDNKIFYSHSYPSGYFRIDGLSSGPILFVEYSDRCFNASVLLMLHHGMNKLVLQICP